MLGEPLRELHGADVTILVRPQSSPVTTLVLGCVTEPVTLRGMRNRLKEFREAAGLSQEQLAEMTGTTRQQISRLEKGSRKLSQEWATRLGGVLERTAGELFGDQLPPKRVRLNGYVGGGEEINVLDGNDAPLGYVPLPLTIKRPAAVVVRGDSMAPQFENGDIIYYEQEELAPEQIVDEACVVQLVSGTIYVKRLLPASGKGRYHLISVNPNVAPIQDQAVAWAARIRLIAKGIKPRMGAPVRR
jgi:transcriptional regulator with XRE-family HTH domain